jgi:hypothetical protein
VVLLASCDGGESEFECDEETPCAQIDQICVEGECEELQCANSTQCPMESYCLAGECIRGCVEEGDCYPGWTCDTELQTCVEEGCQDTQTDCGYREFCNAASGDCYDAGDQYCKFCNEDWECGEGNICYGHYCGVDCSDGRECPAGFECFAFADETGNIVAYQCWTYCWLYEDV